MVIRNGAQNHHWADSPQARDPANVPRVDSRRVKMQDGHMEVHTYRNDEPDEDKF